MTMTRPQIEQLREEWRSSHAARSEWLIGMRASVDRTSADQIELLAGLRRALAAMASLPTETVPVRRVDVAARRRMNTDRNHVVRRAARRQRIARRAAA